MDWYYQILEENKTLEGFHNTASEHVNYWMNSALSGFSPTPETPYIISFVATLIIGLFLLWVFWRLISWPFRKRVKSTGSRLTDNDGNDISLSRPDEFNNWPKTTKNTYIQAQLYLAQQAQQNVDGAKDALLALANKDSSAAINFFGAIRDQAQLKGDVTQQLEMIHYSYALQLPDNIEAAKQTIEHGRSLNPQAPITLLLLADVALKQKKVKEAVPLYNQALQLAKEQNHSKAQIYALATLSQIAIILKNVPQAEKYIQESLALSTGLLKKKKSDTSIINMTANNYSNLASIQQAQKNFDGSLGNYQQALKLKEQFLAADPNKINSEEEIALLHMKIGNLYNAMKNNSAAQHSYQTSVELSKAMLDKHPENLALLRGYSGKVNKLAEFNQKTNNKTAAQEGFTTSLAVREKIVQLKGNDPTLIRDLAIGHERLGDLFSSEKEFSAAGQHYQQAYNAAHKTVQMDPGNLARQEDLTRYLTRIAFIQSSTGKKNEAITTVAKVISIKENSIQKNPNNIPISTSLANSYLFLSKLDNNQAKDLLTKALTLLTPLADKLSAQQKALIPNIQKELASFA